MRDHHRVLEESFLAGQRERRLAERAVYLSAINREEQEDRELQLAAEGHAKEAEDEAQSLMISENNRILVETLLRRSNAIERALAKIDDGTYGLSDVSGKPIPMDRLRAVPEALCTLAEE